MQTIFCVHLTHFLFPFGKNSKQTIGLIIFPDTSNWFEKPGCQFFGQHTVTRRHLLQTISSRGSNSESEIFDRNQQRRRKKEFCKGATSEWLYENNFCKHQTTTSPHLTVPSM